MSIHQFRRIVEGVCPCGTPFKGLKTRKYCSQSCRQKAYLERDRDMIDIPQEWR